MAKQKIKTVKQSKVEKKVESVSDSESEIKVLPTVKKSEKYAAELSARIETLKESVKTLTNESDYQTVNIILGHAFYVRNSRVKLDKSITAESNPIIEGS